VAVFIGERGEGIGLLRRASGHGARRRTASARGEEGDAAHAATVGGRRRAQERGEGDEHSAHRTVGLAGPCPCSLRRAPASASARGELMALRQRWWRGLARSGRRGKRARANRALGGTQSASTRRHDTVDTRGHRANSSLRPAYVQKSCLACCSWWF